MAFIEGVCKNCGASIKFDDSLSSGICEYCGTTFVKEDIIINNHFHNSTIIFNEGNYIEEKLESAETYLNKFHDYEKAKEIFKFVIENKSDDYRGWWGMVQVLTKKFTLTECRQSDYDMIIKYYKNAILVASNEQQELLNSKWIPYSQKVESYIKAENDKNTQKRRNQLIRSSISIVLSLVCNIYVIAFAFTKDMEKISTSWSSFLLMILILFGVNIVATTVLGLIGSTKICSYFPAISAAVFLGVFIFQSFKGINFDIIAILFLLFVLICALGVVAICYIIPHFILNRFLTKNG